MHLLIDMPLSSLFMKLAGQRPRTEWPIQGSPCETFFFSQGHYKRRKEQSPIGRQLVNPYRYSHVHTNCVISLYEGWCEIFIIFFPSLFVWMSTSVTFQDNKLPLSNQKSLSQCIITFYNSTILNIWEAQMGPKCLGLTMWTTWRKPHLQVSLNQRVDSCPYQVGNMTPK